VLTAPDQKIASNNTVKLDGVEQVIASSMHDGNTITINLQTACEVNAGETLTVSLNLDKQ